MKTKTAIFFALLFFTFIFEQTSLLGNITQKKIKLDSDFSKVTLNASAELHIKTGAENLLSIQGEESDIQNIAVTTVNNELQINSKEKAKVWWDVVGFFETQNKTVINLTVKQLEELDILSVGKVFLENSINSNNFKLTSLSAANIKTHQISAENITIKVIGEGSNKFDSLIAKKTVNISSSGSSHMYINKIESQLTNLTIVGNGTASIKQVNSVTLVSNIVGSGSVSISGKVEYQNLVVNGNGRYNSESLITNNTDLTASGGTSIEVSATNELSLSIYGTGIVSVAGQPNINQCNIFGKGQMMLQNGM